MDEDVDRIGEARDQPEMPGPVGVHAQGRHGVVVSIITAGDSQRLCHRLVAGLAGTPWRLERALVSAEQVFPRIPVAVGATTHVVECLLVRTDGNPANPNDLPDILDHVSVIGIRAADPADGAPH